MSNYLRISCASDDLVEFEGAFVEEYNIYERTEFDIDVVSALGWRSLTVSAEFDPDGWVLAVKFYGNEGCDQEHCRFSGVEFSHVGNNNDPEIYIPLVDGETVTVEVRGEDETD